jgi:hypothetical protein
MNRQPVPSILLSVAIVSFFAVTLYQRDGESGRSPKSDGATKAVASDTGRIGRAEVADKGGSHAMQPVMPPAGTVATSTAAHTDHRKSATTAKTAVSPAPGASREPVAFAPGPSIRAVSNRPAVAEPSQTASPSARPRPSGWKEVPTIPPVSSARGRSGTR